MPLFNEPQKPVPKPGMRIIKTAIATFFCFVIDYLRGVNQPIYAVLSAIICMQKDFDNSWIMAKNRLIGTAIGGFFGVITLLIVNNVPFFQIEIIRFAVCSVMIVPLLYITNLIGKQSASSVTCVTFASIVIIHVGSSQVPYFALSRMMDTTVGIIVSLLVNIIFTRKMLNRILRKKIEQ